MAADPITSLSWAFPVDSGYNYQVRLNLCKVSADEANTPGLFQISLANQTPLRRPDLSTQNENLQQNMQLTVQQNVAANIGNEKIVLNGVEVYRVGDTNHNSAPHNLQTLMSYSTGPSYNKAAFDGPVDIGSTSSAPTPNGSTDNETPSIGSTFDGISQRGVVSAVVLTATLMVAIVLGHVGTPKRSTVSRKRVQSRLATSVPADQTSNNEVTATTIDDSTPEAPPSSSSLQGNSITGSSSSTLQKNSITGSSSNSLQRDSPIGSQFSSRHKDSLLGSNFGSLQRNSPTGSQSSSLQWLGTPGSSASSNRCCIFSLEEIKDATKNFDRTLLIGRGGFGNVYKGVFYDGLIQAAIKRWNPILSDQGMNEFRSEIEKLSTLRHRNLVSLIGFCEGYGEMILVYEYMPRGTLHARLYKEKQSLPWKTRLKICIGAARGLHYLHTGTQQSIIHRDVKTSNILLDDNLDAKISDFGLSRIGPDETQSHVSTQIKGSLGYIAPEYWNSGHLTKKSDVYSFGVVLLEVLSGRSPWDPLLSNQQPLSLARRYFKKGNLEPLIDPSLKPQIERKCLRIFSKTVIECLSMDHNDRPSMGTVLNDLEVALHTLEKAQKSRSSDSVLATFHTVRM